MHSGSIYYFTLKIATRALLRGCAGFRPDRPERSDYQSIVINNDSKHNVSINRKLVTNNGTSEFVCVS